MAAMPIDERRDPTDPPPDMGLEPGDHRPPRTVEELLRNVDGRSMEMLQGLGRLTGEVSGQRKQIDSHGTKLEGFDSRFRKLELNFKQVVVDVRAIKEALRREGKHVEELKVEFKDFVDDVEDSKRFILQQKKERKFIAKGFGWVAMGTAMTFGTFLAGMLWQNCMRAPIPQTEIHVHEPEK